MKSQLILSIIAGLFILSTCNGTPELTENSAQENIEENSEDKRFGKGPSSFSSDSDSDNNEIVDWSSAFKKRFGQEYNKDFVMNDMNKQHIVDWFNTLKRFNHPASANFDSADQDGSMVGWHAAFKKRFQSSNDEDEQQLIDWSNMFKKRFGNPQKAPESPNLVDWSLAFSKKKRSKR